MPQPRQPTRVLIRGLQIGWDEPRPARYARQEAVLPTAGGSLAIKRYTALPKRGEVSKKVPGPLEYPPKLVLTFIWEQAAREGERRTLGDDDTNVVFLAVREGVVDG